VKSLSSYRFWFLAGIAIIPLVYSNATVDPVFTLRAILLAALTIVAIIATRKQPVRTSPLLWIWSIYAVFSIVSIFVAQNSGEAIYKASLVLLYGAWLFAAMQVMSKDLLSYLLRTIALLGFAVSVIALVQFFELGFGFIPGGEGPFATMTTKNLLSSFLFLTLPATVYVTITNSREWSWFGLLTLTATVFVLLITQTRAVWVGCAVMAMVVGFLFILTGNRKKLWEIYKSNIRNAAIAIAACLIAIFVFNVAPRNGSHEKSASQKAGSILNYSSDTSANMRLTVWKESFELFRDHPILGVGGGNWKIALPAYGLAKFPHYVQDGSYQWTETHNDFLAALCETGIAGGIAYAAFFIFAIYLGIRNVGKKSNIPNEMILVILTTSMLCGFALISFFDFPMSRVEHTMLLMLWISILTIIAGKGKGSPKIDTRYGALLLTIPALWLSIQRFKAETHERDLLQARIDQDPNNVIQECNKIYNARLLSVDALSTPILYYKAEAEFMQQDYTNALHDNLMALQEHPNHFYTLNNTGTCYVKLSNSDSGKVFYKKALAISPNFEESLLNLTAVYFNEKRYDSALLYLSRCDTTQPGSRAQDYARALHNSGH
jgi:O-antigen ligase